jgi:hypothetical protein
MILALLPPFILTGAAFMMALAFGPFSSFNAWPQSGVMIAALIAIAWIGASVGAGLVITGLRERRTYSLLLGIELTLLGVVCGFILMFVELVLYTCYENGMCL